MHHCTPAWVTRAKFHLKKQKQNKKRHTITVEIKSVSGNGIDAEENPEKKNCQNKDSLHLDINIHKTLQKIMLAYLFC